MDVWVNHAWLSLYYPKLSLIWCQTSSQWWLFAVDRNTLTMQNGLERRNNIVQ